MALSPKYAGEPFTGFTLDYRLITLDDLFLCGTPLYVAHHLREMKGRTFIHMAMVSTSQLASFYLSGFQRSLFTGL